MKLNINNETITQKPKFSELLPMLFYAIGSRPLELLRALLIPAALLVLAGWLIQIEGSLWITGAVLLSLFPILTLFSTRVHRAFLLEESPTWNLRQLWTRRESLFLGYVVLVLLLLLAILAVALPVDNGFLTLGLVFVFVYLVTRLSLVFPSAAVGDSMTLMEAWKISGKHQWYLLWAIVGITMILNAITKPLESFVEMPLPVELLVALVETVITIGALSVAYREIRRFETDATPTEPSTVA